MADPITYHPAPEATEIAEKLIKEYHPHLEGFALRIVMRSKAPTVGKWRHSGKATALGTAEIIIGRLAYFVMTDEELALQEQQGFEDPYKMFWMELSAPGWESLNDQERAALVDHELCHFGVEWPEEAIEPKMFIARHDIEEFEDIVRRHGPWKRDLSSFCAALMGMEGT